MLVVYGGFGWVGDGGDFAVEHHDRDQPDTTFRAKISYRR
ncbi:hypothetical protein JOD27_003707 [Lentzea nigeriaca]|nr:hypothetical protein [Lentzea nigeriaca]